MPDSLRQQIIDAVDTRFKTILTANGYETDLGQNVFHWKENAFEQDHLPCLEYRDVSDPPEDIAFQLRLHTITLEVRAYAKGSDVDKTARKLIADIVKCIGTDLTWGGLAEDTEQISVPGEINMDHAEKKIAGTLLVFEIEYTSDRFDPYS